MTTEIEVRPRIEAPPLGEVKQMWLKGFTKPSSRSLQAKLGPSEVGSCAYCVGESAAFCRGVSAGGTAIASP